MIRPVVAVDLASRFTAGVSLGSDGKLVSQWDSGGMSYRALVDRIYDDYAAANTFPPVVVVEDIPPRNLPSLRAVLQLQGRIIQKFAEAECLADLFFVQPSKWQHDMKVWRASTDEAEVVASGYGYLPPDMLEQRGLVRGQRGTSTLVREADKQRTDYVSAFLIAQWARQSMVENQVWGSQVRQYTS